MDQVTFAWTLAATLISGIQVFAGKVVAHEKRDSAFNGIFNYGVAAVIALGIVVFRNAWPEHWILISVIAIVAGGVHAVGNFFRIESLKSIDSIMYFPVNKILGPILIVSCGILLFGDTLSVTQFIGIGLSLVVPVLLFSQSEHHRQINLRKGVILLVVSTVLTVIGQLLSKQGLIEGADVVFFLFVSQTAGLLISLMIYMIKNNGNLAASLTTRDLVLGFWAGLLGFVSFFSLLMALSTGYISLVFVIHAHYILIPIILSVWMHKDHINAQKLTAIVISSLAIILLYKA